LPIKRSLAATAAVALTGAMLSVIAGTTTSASAACAPSTIVSPVASATKHPHIASSTTVRKLRKKHYAASVRITATQGAATVTVSQSVCPDGAAGAAASTAQTASGVGVVTRTVSAKGSSKAAAKRAAKAKAKKAVAKIKSAAKTKQGLAAAKRRAIAAAQPVASAEAHHALYDARVGYYVASGPALTEVATRPAGAMSLSGSANGDLVLTVPAGASGGIEAFACLRRAPAWPTNFVFDATSVSSPQLAAYARASDTTAGIEGVTVRGITSASPAAGSYFVAAFESDGSQVTGVESLDPTSTDDAVCFVPIIAGEVPASTVTLHGPRVGTSLSAPDANGLSHLVGGVPVTIG